jgi:hypothetical protein
MINWSRETRRSSRLIFGIVAAVLLATGWLILPGPRALAAEPGILAGQVVNKTPGGSVPAQIPIELQVFNGMTREENRAGETDVSGNFKFENLKTSQEYNYQITAHYKGASYYSDIISLTANPKPAPISIAVYETTGEDPGIRVERAHIIINVSPRSLQVGQLYVFTNPGDRVYVSSHEGGAGPTLKFSLPGGATDLQFQDGALGDRYQSAADGFVDTWPVMPGVGAHQVLYSYRVPFNSPQATLLITTPYSVTALNVLVSDVQAQLTSPILQNEGVRTVENQQWLSFSGKDIARGQPVVLKLSNLPLSERAAPAASTQVGVVLQGTPIWQLVVFGLTLFGFGVVVGHSYARVRLRPAIEAPMHPAPAASDDPDDLIVALADLDDAFERGDISEEEYRPRRERLKRAVSKRTAHRTD